MGVDASDANTLLLKKGTNDVLKTALPRLLLLLTLFVTPGAAQVLKDVKDVKDGGPDHSLDFYWRDGDYDIRLMSAAAQPVRSPGLPERLQLFGANTISTGEVYRGSFAPDGKAFYFFRKVTPDQEDYRIFVSRLKQGQWSGAEQVRLGGDHSDLYPSISRDGKRMVFASYRPAPGHTAEKPDANLWYVERRGSGWGEPVLMAAASTPGNYDAGPEFGPDDAIYFDTTTPDWKTTTALVTRWNGKEYGKPERFEAVEGLRGWNAGYRLWQGSLSRGGSLLFLVVSELDPVTQRPKPSDLWFTRRRNGQWTTPQPLGAGINTPGGENFPVISPDGRELIFIRDFARFYRVSLAEALGATPGERR